VTSTSPAQSSLTTISTDNTFLVGATSYLPTGLFRGDISELVIVPSSISDADLASFREYARRTWAGLPADTGQPPNPCRDATGQPLPPTTVCDDGNAATVADRCVNGACAGQIPASGNPGALSPLVWYSAADLDTTTSGAGVLQWLDRSGNGRHLTQAFTPGQPTFQATGWNGNRPTLVFNGGNAFRRDGWTDPPAGDDRAFTVLAVVRSATNQNAGVAGWFNSGGGDSALCKLKSAGAQNFLDLVRTNGVAASQDFVGSHDVGTGRHVVAWRFSPEAAKLTVDGVTTFTSNQPSLAPIAIESFLVGTTSLFGTEMFRGELSELAVIPGSVSDAAISAFLSYAQQTWGGLP